MDEQLGVSETNWSEVLAKNALWLLVQVEDELAEQILHQIGGITVSDTSIWRQAQECGEKIKGEEEGRIATAMVVQEYGGVVRGESNQAYKLPPN